MPADAAIRTDAPAPKPALARKLVRRHSLLVRLTHWVNVVSLVFLLLSGLQIFNAHPALYWGQKSTFNDPWISMSAQATPKGRIGVTRIGSARFDTTGVLGLSMRNGQMEDRGFPAWATLPAGRNLGQARHWHFLAAWVFAINLIIYVVSALVGGHLRRDIWPTAKDMRHLGKDIVDHARLRFPQGWDATRYSVLQKLAYLITAFLALPLMVLTGMTMSPGFNAAFPWMLDLFGGRQSARTIHFLVAAYLVLFVIVHLVMVVLSGPLNQLRAMITGGYVIRVPVGKEGPR